MKSTTYILLSLLLVGFMMTAPVYGQNTFTGAQSTAWHDDENWTGLIPIITDDVLIPQSLTCIVSGSVDAVAKSIEVEATAVLQIQDALTLQIRTPNGISTPALTVDGQLNFDENGVLQLEDDATGDDIARIAGSGSLNSTDAFFATGSGANAVDRMYVGQNISVYGGWTITIDVENDGLFESDFDDMRFAGDGVLRLSGSGVIRSTNGAFVNLDCINYEPGGTFDGTLEATANGNIYLNSCFFKPDLEAATLTIDGGQVRANNGFNMTGGQFSILAGFAQSEGTIDLRDTSMTISGSGSVYAATETVILRDASPLKIEDDGYLRCGTLLVKGGAANPTITIDGGTSAESLRCDTFDITGATVAISGGEFHLVGAEVSCNNFESSTLTLSGGTLFLGGTFDGTFSSSVTISGGLLDIQVDNPCIAQPDEDFRHKGPFSFTGAKIKVAQNKIVKIAPN